MAVIAQVVDNYVLVFDEFVTLNEVEKVTVDAYLNQLKLFLLKIKLHIKIIL